MQAFLTKVWSSTKFNVNSAPAFQSLYSGTMALLSPMYTRVHSHVKSVCNWTNEDRVIFANFEVR